MLRPRVDRLPPAQQRLWTELGGTPGGSWAYRHAVLDIEPVPDLPIRRL